MDDLVGWVVAVGIAFVTFRYFFASPTPNSTTSSGNRRPIPQSQIETVSNMFPSIPTVSIRYELERTGGNVQGVVERCLRDGRLPEPPAGFFPDEVPPVVVTPIISTSTLNSTMSKSSPPISLITKLGLERRKDLLISSTLVGGGDQGEEEVEGNGDGNGNGKGKSKVVVVWETSSEKRESSLKERKAKMVLEARRKLLEKEKERLGKGKGKAIE